MGADCDGHSDGPSPASANSIVCPGLMREVLIAHAGDRYAIAGQQLGRLWQVTHRAAAEADAWCNITSPSLSACGRATSPLLLRACDTADIYDLTLVRGWPSGIRSTG
jgi:hypothetical protein